MTILVATHPQFGLHDPGPWHPECPDRLGAVFAGLSEAGLDGALETFEPRMATSDEIARVHPGRYLGDLEALALAGGGRVDADTALSAGSYDAALLAAGAGLDAIERLDAGAGEAAFCVVRPPGHHATPSRAMGFCLVNNVAVAAASLADRGERVLVVDYDAHHGNGTQDVFYGDRRVVYVSLHEYPLYPGTGAIGETGSGDGLGSTINLPVPAGTTGDVYRAAVDEIVRPLADVWDPTWLIISAGFDAHRSDPLTGLGLQAGDFADLTAALCELVPAGRRLLFLEGGYDLDALAHSAGATFARLVDGSYRPEPSTSGGPGMDVVHAVRRMRDDAGWA